MTEPKKAPRERNAPLTPLKAAYKVAQLLQRVPPESRKGVLSGAAAELGITLEG